MKKKTIWLLTTGEYSDKSVIAAFGSREAVLKYHKGFSDYNDPEEIPYNPTRPLELKLGMSIFYVHMLKDGKIYYLNSRCMMTRVSVYELYDGELSSEPKWTVKLIATVAAKDEKHAVKICNEKRAQYIASGEWDRLQAELDEKKRAWMLKQEKKNKKGG